MAYVKTTWTNGATALSAEHMNNIEDGIAALDTGKVDKEVGKGLSTNDYTTEEKEKLVALDATKVDKVAGKGLSTNDYTTEEKTKLSNIEAGAEVNQNAFGNVKVGSTTIAADGKTDTLELAAGTNITLTPDATNDKVIVACSMNVSRTRLNLKLSEPLTIAAKSSADAVVPLSPITQSNYLALSGYSFLADVGNNNYTRLNLPIIELDVAQRNGVDVLVFGLYNNNETSTTLTDVRLSVLHKS